MRKDNRKFFLLCICLMFFIDSFIANASQFKVRSWRNVEAPANVRPNDILSAGTQIVIGVGGFVMLQELTCPGIHSVMNIPGLHVLPQSSNCKPTSDSDRVASRIKEGENVAERIVMLGVGKGDDPNSEVYNKLLKIAYDPCIFLPFLSEESGHNYRVCPSGYALKGVRCQGSNCDNKYLKCCPYLDGNADVHSTAQNAIWISEEQGGGRSNAFFSSGFFNGLQCKGRYCDDIYPATIFSHSFQNTGNCYMTPFFSEEFPSEFECMDNAFVSGIMCSGGYCDNIALNCCELRRMINP